jgi:hypothetical protein
MHSDTRGPTHKPRKNLPPAATITGEIMQVDSAIASLQPEI